MSELTIEQKVQLLERLLGYEQKLPEVDMTIAPVKWYAIVRSGAVLISKPFQLPNVGGKFDGWYDYSYDAFKPEENLVQTIMLLEGLVMVTGEYWQLALSPTQLSPARRYRLSCTGKSKLNYKDSLLKRPYDEYELAYNKYGDDLCELIVNACLWWLKENNSDGTTNVG